MKHFYRTSLITMTLLLVSGVLSAAEITLTAPAQDTVVSQLNTMQKEYLAMPHDERIAFFADQKSRNKLKDLGGNHPMPIQLAWDWDGPAWENFTVTVSTSPDLTDGMVVQTDETAAEVTNLLIGKKYYWQVSTTIDNRPYKSEVGVFTTDAEAPRLLRIKGVPNVRDLGGWKTLSGKHVKQGLAYRSAGLNDNSKPINYTREELEEAARTNTQLREEYEKRLPQDQELVRAISAQQQILNGSLNAKIIPYALSATWIAFRPDPKTYTDEAARKIMDGLTAVPEIFMNAKAEKAVTNGDGRFAFDEIQEFAPAIFMQEFESPEDGFMQLNCGADWFWYLRINGQLAYDRSGRTIGNGMAVSAKNHVLQIPVHKGRNLIVVSVLSGSAGWAWCCAPLPDMTAQDAAKAMIKGLEQTRRRLWDIPVARKVGPNRLDAETQKYLTVDLGIRTDIDLRNDIECYGMRGSPLGYTAAWFHYSSSAYDGMQTQSGKDAFTKVFKVFLDKNNYPLDFHCIGGQDRTGAVAFIINGLLGVSEEDLYRDWEISGFYNPNVNFTHEQRFNKLVQGFQSFPGKDIHEKIENYVLSLGFTQHDIRTLRDNLLEN